MEAQKQKKGKNKCRGCHKLLGLALFKYNEPFCVPCELTMNSLRRVCERQGSIPWYNEQRQCEQKSKALISNYRSHKKLVDAGEKAGRWLVASAKDELSATQEADYVDRGRLMDKTTYVEWMSQKKPGKKMAMSDAVAQFEAWEKDPDSSGAYWEQDEDLTFLFRVHTHKDLDYHKKFARKKASVPC